MSKTLSAEEQSKDKYFAQLSKISEEMIEEHGKDFAMGALVMAAQWIAKNQLGAQEDVVH
ncbi:hypothetical protein [Ruegeria sp. EL01]|jgi:hypothetical protein|uniref:hypothetical protein n=1 Tax=Ruegeria sp. EL01 TaxID=2107578 RepID=UPI000EA7F25F|nr:hypothetical protein [Ruegeria sp. EL01]